MQVVTDDCAALGAMAQEGGGGCARGASFGSRPIGRGVLAWAPASGPLLYVDMNAHVPLRPRSCLSHKEPKVTGLRGGWPLNRAGQRLGSTAPVLIA